MLKAAILCIVLKADEVPVDEPLSNNTRAESNTSSIVNSIVDSGVIGSVDVSNSSWGNETVMNNKTDKSNTLDNISDLTPSGEGKETVLATINQTE